MDKNKWKWDPSWGWDGEIYYLSCKRNTLFFDAKNSLSKNNKVILSFPKVKMCAGSFNKEFYFGSMTHDIKKEELNDPSEWQKDQSLFVCDKSWEKISEYRPSLHIEKKSKYFSNISSKSGRLLVPFRDPTMMPNGNLAVVTGGWRWNTFGNICEISFKNNQWQILRETILDDGMTKYSEIERPTFWREFMFYSVRGALDSKVSRTTIEVAKLSKNGLYKYFGRIKNSECCYGPCVDEDLRMLFWYPKLYTFNNPIEQNIFYENKEWVLKEEKKLKHFFFQNRIKFKTLNEILVGKVKKIIKNS